MQLNVHFSLLLESTIVKVSLFTLGVVSLVVTGLFSVKEVIVAPVVLHVVDVPVLGSVAVTA